MKLPKTVKEAFALELEAAKFMATRDANGVPNIAMISTISPWEKDEEQLIFGNFLMWQTKKNLENGSPVSISVMTLDFKSYEVRGRFLGFETSGEKFDTMSSKDLFRYSAIGLLRSVGTIAIDEIYPIKLSMLGVGTEWFLAKIAGKRIKDLEKGKGINPLVMQNVGVLQGSKFLTVSRKDHMEQFPILGMKPVDDYVIIRSDLPLKEGDNIAISAFNMELKAFQIKGEYMGVRRSRGVKFGYIRVNNVLTQTPPLVSREVPTDN
ncbi:MAG: hypothetical protein JSW11_16830 [Candidatus Heimdallarchaeota archaeon]|nr:MAG: hypothetical protein JSW11_16830 [Candidatus Heimdallarchaeota archaeon]